ncbi:hypothetical protein TcG_08724 [Trypanosoma cruzi]|nr:hypothetical protein TcG_08724 [Trypanosoma cruzi]
MKQQSNNSVNLAVNKLRKEQRVCHEHRRYAAPTRGFAPSRCAERSLGENIYTPRRNCANLLVKQSFPTSTVFTHLFFLRSPAETGSGVKADLFHRTVHVGRFSRCPVDTHNVSCGGGSIRHRCGAKSRVPDGKIQPVVILSGRRPLFRRSDSRPSWNRRRRDVDE